MSHLFHPGCPACEDAADSRAELWDEIQSELEEVTAHRDELAKELSSAEAEVEALKASLSSVKAFHYRVSELAGWQQDEKDWLRDLACVEESLRNKFAAAEAQVKEWRERYEVKCKSYAMAEADVASLAGRVRELEKAKAVAEAAIQWRIRHNGNSMIVWEDVLAKAIDDYCTPAPKPATLKFFCNHGNIDCPKCQPPAPPTEKK